MKANIKNIFIGGSLLMSANLMATQAVWKGSAVLTIKKKHLESFKKAVRKITAPTRKEKGAIFYEGYQVLDKDGKETNRFEFHEIWTSKDAMMIDHKENSQHMKTFFSEIKADSPDSFIEKFEVDGKWVKVIQ